MRNFKLDLTAAVSPSLAVIWHPAGLYIFAPGPVGVGNALIRTQQPNNTQNPTVLLRSVQTYHMERYNILMSIMYPCVDLWSQTFDFSRPA